MLKQGNKLSDLLKKYPDLPVLFECEYNWMEFECGWTYQEFAGFSIDEIVIYCNKWYNDSEDFIEEWVDMNWDKAFNDFCAAHDSREPDDAERDEIESELTNQAERLWDEHCKEYLVISTNFARGFAEVDA